MGEEELRRWRIQSDSLSVSRVHGAMGTASRPQENHVLLFPCGVRHTPRCKHSIRERKTLSRQSPALGTRCLVREGDQSHTKVGNCVYVRVLEKVRSLFSQTSSAQAEPFVGTGLHLFPCVPCLLVSS